VPKVRCQAARQNKSRHRAVSALTRQQRQVAGRNAIRRPWRHAAGGPRAGGVQAVRRQRQPGESSRNGTENAGVAVVVYGAVMV